jgi:N-acetylmuramoyl-L-alanine amidase
MIVIIDNGHGVDTKGKCSPVWGDGSKLWEYEFNRDIAARVAYKCKCADIPFKMLVTEMHDVSLAERVRRANAIDESDKDAFLVSIHANAGGGTGWEVWTSVGYTKSDVYATIFFEEAMKAFPEWKMRRDMTDGDADKETQFYILKNTKCPAVLTENFFMDTERDCRFILSETGRESIATMHFKAIKRIFNEYGKS